MPPKYPAKNHARRVAKSLQAKSGLIYIPGYTSRTYEDSDMAPEFRQRRYFFYMSGVNEADCSITYDIASDKLVLWIPEQRTTREILYMGPVITRKEALRQYDIDDAFPSLQLKDFLQNFLEKKEALLYLLYKKDLNGFNDIGSIDGVSLKPAMNACRVIKDDVEIEYIREANRITAEAHIQALRNCKLVSNESAIHGIFVGTCLALGAKSQAYYPIVGAGPNAATLHYVKNDEDLKGKQLLLIDAGCEWNSYACDVTRTFPLGNDWPSKESRAIYKIVEDMQESCIAQMRPGVLFRDLNVLAHHIAVKGLLKLGILHNGTEEEIIKAGTSLAFFPHGLGHHVGLEVHDPDDLNNPMPTEAFRPFALANTAIQPISLEQGPFVTNVTVDTGKELEIFSSRYGHLIQDSLCHAPVSLRSSGLRTGMVVTVEPGIYFNEFGLEKVYLPSPLHSKYINQEVLKSYMPVGGVRIEDDLLVTENGSENLTITPKGDEALKIIRGEA